ALLAAILLVYRPAWSGGFLWDDAAHLTRGDLRSWQGLWRIWFDPGATQQHYPLVHSAFWLQQRLWGNDPTGYHLVTVLLHFGAAAGPLVAPRTAVVAARRRPAPPVLRPRRGGRSVHHLGGAAPGGRRRRGIRSQRRAAGPDRRPRRLVLSRQARVACRPRLHL